jgi:uncharacterized surface protein with fasciclin (FAS1) repeats
MSRRITMLTAAIAALAMTASLAVAAPQKNIVETAASSPKFDTLVQLVKDAGLAKTLSGKGPYTVFAPTDRAFDKVPDATLNKLANDRRMLRQVLLYHVVPGKLPAAKVVNRSGAETAQGSRVRFSVRDGKAFVNRSRIVITDIRASNGIVHAINRVLIPPAG